MTSFLQYKIAGKTHVGHKRSNNEDNLFFQSERPVMMVVADGMGGHASGEVASKLVVESIPLFFQASYRFSKGDFQAIARNLIRNANHAVKEGVHIRPECWSMGSTVVLALPHKELCKDPSNNSYYGNYITIAHIGDSRCYMMRDGILKLQTKDHSDGGNLLHRAIGHGTPVPDVVTLPVVENDIFLLCSDGLNKMVRDEDICSTLQNARTCEQAVVVLIQKALDAGGDDNITVIVAKAVDTTLENFTLK